MLTITPADQLNVINETKLQSVLNSMMMEVGKSKSSRYRTGDHCSLPATYKALSQSEKDHLKPILEKSGYYVRMVNDEGQGRSWERLEW